MRARPVAAGRAAARPREGRVERTQSRRVERRTPYRVPCRIRLVDPGSGSVRTVVGETVNLSSGGLAMNVGVETPVGTWVETLVPHPNGDPLFLCGKVVHVRQTMFSNFELGVVISGEHPPAF